VNKLRQALTDSAEEPRYVETIPGQGYRFIAPVEVVSPPTQASETPIPASKVASTTASKARLWAAALAVFLGGLISGWLIRSPQAPSPASPVQFTIPVTPGFYSEPAFNVQDFAVSPSGEQLAFIASDATKSGLWIRQFGSLDPARLVTERNVRSLDWSADGRFVYFGEGGALRRIPAAGGASETVCDLPSGAGAWNSLVEFGNQLILFTRTGKAFGVAPTGGTATPRLLDAVEYLWPRRLPDGYLLHVAFDRQVHRFRAWVSNIANPKERHALMETDSRVLYAPPIPGRRESHLLYVRGGSLVAQAFDARARRLVGQPFPIAEKVFWYGPSAAAAISVSDNGVLVYRTVPGPSQLKWVDRTGRQIATVAQPAIFMTQFRLSPDRTRLAASIYDVETGGPQLRSYDLSTRAARRISGAPATYGAPVWAPDGKRVVLARAEGAPPRLAVKSISENAPEELLTPAPFQLPTDWSPDGRFIAYQTSGSISAPGADVFAVDLLQGRRLVPLIQSPAQEMGAGFSPDATWLTYLSDQGGRSELYAQAFAAYPTARLAGTPRQISTNGASVARWRPDGKELYYLSADNWLMSVAVSGRGKREFAKARKLFHMDVPPRSLTFAGIEPGFDVSADGQRFLIADPLPVHSPPFVVIENWQALLNQHAQ
jgi:Tol biopolymer transport system component